MRGTAPPPFLASVLEVSGWSAPRPGRVTPGKATRYPLYRWLGKPVWTGEENLAPIEIRFPNHPAHRETLHRLSYSGPQGKII